MSQLGALMRLLLTLATVLLVSACDAPARPMHAVTLPSGKQIKAFDPGIGKFGDHWTVYDFDYLTTLPLSLPMTPAQRDAAAEEADEIWAVIRPDVEKAGFRLAEVRGQTDVAKGLPFGNAGYSAHGACFAYERDADGTWWRDYCGASDVIMYAKDPFSSDGLPPPVKFPPPTSTTRVRPSAPSALKPTPP